MVTSDLWLQALDSANNPKDTGSGFSRQQPNPGGIWLSAGETMYGELGKLPQTSSQQNGEIRNGALYFVTRH